MKINPSRQVFLTFDIEGPKGKEDFFQRESAEILLRVLRLLKRFRLRGLFFITGTVTERLVQFPEITGILRDHLVGYHSSSHSIKPRIFEYTDVKDYRQAIQESLKRETSSIDPRTGRIAGKGGILQLRKVFCHTRVECFRAPFLCWSPPHLESLRKLGIKYDFSTNISSIPMQHRGLTFFPQATVVDTIPEKVASLVENQKRVLPTFLLQRILAEQCTVLLIHPSKLVPSQCCTKNTKSDSDAEVYLAECKSPVKLTVSFAALRMLFSGLSLLQRTNAIVVTPSPRTSDFNLETSKIRTRKIYMENASICKKLFNYEPNHMLAHFAEFFEAKPENVKQDLVEE